MIKKILVSACLLLSLVSFAQEGTSSLVLFMELGCIGSKERLKIVLCGVAVEQDSIHMNIQNPASYANLKHNFTLGGTYATALKKRRICQSYKNN
jgi:hypothetical protein